MNCEQSNGERTVIGKVDIPVPPVHFVAYLLPSLVDIVKGVIDN